MDTASHATVDTVCYHGGHSVLLTGLCIDVADGLQQQQRVEFCVLDKNQQQFQ